MTFSSTPLISSDVSRRPRRRTAAYMGWLALLVLGVSPADAKWWNSDWSIRKRITVDLGGQAAAIKDRVGDAVLLIRLHDGNFQFSAAKEDGSDIRLVAADEKTPLTFHIERYDPLLAEAFLWVKVPNLQPNGQTTL